MKYFGYCIVGFLFFSCTKRKQFRLIPPTETGIYFSNKIEESDSLNILVNEYMYNGGGIAVGDFNNDGREDIFFSGNIVDNKLYLNMGNLKFKEVTEEANVACTSNWSMGVSTIDVNQDGWLDLYIAVTGKGDPDKRKNKLLVNQGIDNKGVPIFKDEAEKYGLDHSGFSINSYFFDYDHDGDLDLYIINNHFTNRGDVLSKRKLRKNLIENNINHLLRNEGNYFVNVTDSVGIKNDGYSLAAAIMDVNQDGWEDIFVSNDFVTSSALYVNQRDGTFKEDIGNYFKHQSFSSMGIDVADFDNNLEEDLISLDMLPNHPSRVKQMFSKANFLFYDLLDYYKEEPQYMRNCFYVAENGNYNEIGQLLNVHNTDWSWSPLLVDVDNDGKKDLSITNGFPRDLTDLDFINYRNSYESILATQEDYLADIPRVKIANYIFKNEGNYNFTDVSSAWDINRPSYSSGQVYADFDNDGDLEIIVSNINDEVYFYENQSSTTKNTNFISFQLKGPKGNIGALNTTLSVFYDNKKQQLRQNPYRGYLSSVTRNLHFGLGDHTSSIDSVRIDWNGEKYSMLYNVKSNKQHLLDYDKINITNSHLQERQPLLFRALNQELNLDFTHKENKSYDFYQHELLQRVFSNEGPPMVVGDIDGDKDEDIIIGGAAGQSVYVFNQTINGRFLKDSISLEDKTKEATALALFDLDNDNHLDLYVGFGHNGSNTKESLMDELFRNDGKGNFTSIEEGLPPNNSVTSKVIPFDYDQDGDQDVLVTTRLLLNQYPLLPKSYYFENIEGKLVDVTNQKLPKKGYLGRISDAELFFEKEDKTPSVIFLGDWEGIHQLIYRGNSFELKENIVGEKWNGLWNSIEVNDLDDDGDMDIIAGNYGLNTPFSASSDQPFLMLYKGLNNNEYNNPVLFNDYKGKYYPIHLRNNFLNQFQGKKQQFPNYKTYANASLTDLFTQEELEQLEQLEVHSFCTTIFENTAGKFISHSLPKEVQFSPVFASQVINLFGDKHILFAGNDNAHEVFTGPKNAFKGELIKVHPGFKFERIPPSKSGITISGAAKQIVSINREKDTLALISQNDDQLLIYKLIQKNR